MTILSRTNRKHQYHNTQTTVLIYEYIYIYIYIYILLKIIKGSGFCTQLLITRNFEFVKQLLEFETKHLRHHKTHKNK